MGWSDKYKKSINCNNPKGFSQKAHCQGKKKRKENIMKLSELKETIRTRVNERFYQSLSEASYKIGSKLYVTKKLKDDEILDLAKKYVDYPHSKLRKQQELVNAYRDISNLLGIPTKHPMDSIKYFKGVPKRIQEPKPVGSKSYIFPLLKSKKIDTSEYKLIWKGLYRRYVGVITQYLSFLYATGTYAPVKSKGGARRAAMKDMGL